MHPHGNAYPDEQGWTYLCTDPNALTGDQNSSQYEYRLMGGRWNNDSMFQEDQDKQDKKKGERYTPKSRAPFAEKAVPKSAIQDKARAKSPDKARI